MSCLRSSVLCAVALLACAAPALAQYRRCGAADIRNYGAKTDGSDDGPALRAANSGPSPFLYAAPEGNVFNTQTVNVLSSVDLSKPLVMGYQMRFNIPTRVKLTLRAQPVFHRTQVFTGRGRVRFIGGPFIVLPEWWGTSSGAVARMTTACAMANCTIAWTGLMLDMAAPITLAPNLQFWSGQHPGINAALGSSLVGFNFLPGDYSRCRPYVLPSLGRYRTAIQATSTSGLRVQSSGIGATDTGVLLQGDVAKTSINLGIASDVRALYAFAARTLTRVNLLTNFAVNIGAGAGSLAEFRSVPTRIKQSKAALTAADGNTPNTDVALVRNVGLGTVKDFVFTISAWGGNYASAVNMVKGAFQGLRVLGRMATYYPSAMSGPNNAMAYGSFNGPWPQTLSVDPNNPGERILTNLKVVYIKSSDIIGTWQIDEDRHFYTRHTLLSGGQQRRIVLSPGPTNTGASDWYNPGLVVKEVVDESNISPYRLRITFTNKSNRPITAATFQPWWDGLGLDWRLYVGVPGVGSA